MADQIDQLIEFPCDHVFKVVGDSRETFMPDVHRAVCSVVPVSLDAVKTRSSGNGKYLSVSVVARLENREQLLAIYAGLKKIAGIRFLL